VNQLLKRHPKEIAAVLAKYPPDQAQAAVLPLLHMAQKDTGFISRTAIAEIAEITGITTTEVASVVGFYTLFHE
jgi:NADH-quinone oxidoreductase subunit E